MSSNKKHASGSLHGDGSTYNDTSDTADVRLRNMVAGKAIADIVRTSLGPRGMDKMVIDGRGDVVVTNDGATILKQIQVESPAARMLVELSRAQDTEAGDGTTTVVVMAGSLLNSARGLLTKLHPNVISRSFRLASDKAVEVLESMATPVDLSDRDTLIKNASTSLNSKIISQNSSLLAPLSVDAVMKVCDREKNTCDLTDIKVIKCFGGTVDDSEMVDGIVFPKKAAHFAGGPTRIENAKIGLIQFCISPPKTDMENNVVVSDYAAMDRLLREEKQYILKICKQIKAAGCTVLLIQKSILRDAVNELALHFLAKMKIMVIRDIERDEVEFICKATKCTPIATPEAFTADKLGACAMCEEVSVGVGKVVKVTGIENAGRVATILLRGSNKMLLDEAERSFHDSLCATRCLVKRSFLICGGGAPEIELAIRLSEYAKTLVGQESYCVRAFAEALEIIPYTLAENAGLNPMSIVTELRNRHVNGEKFAGINVRKGAITDMFAENVLQPLLVDTSAITLASECVRAILKIDDIVPTR
jgi:T-complex protein 1 subunit delta